MNKINIILAGAAASLMATSAIAQTALGDSAAEQRIEDLNENIADDFDRDLGRFGNAGRPLGFDGSVSLQANTTNGNSDNTTVGIGTDLGYYDGTNGYQLQLSYQYSETDGQTTEDSLLYDLGYTRDFGSAYYGFAKLQGTVDGGISLDGVDLDTSDNFLGVGVGYKIYDTRDIQWSVEGGVGYRVADLNRTDDLDEGAISLSSNYFNRINDTLYLTNDTDIIASDADTVVFNDLGMNVSMTETLALRASLLTEYHTDPQPGFDDTDNQIGMSLVYNFN